MRGMRPLTPAEIAAVLRNMDGELGARDRALFLLGLHTGFRITELLSLRIRDVWDGVRVLDRIEVARRFMKRKRSSRNIVLHPRAGAAIEAWIRQLAGHGFARPFHPLFRSWRDGGIHGQALSVSGAGKMLRAVYKRAGLTGRIGTHGMRKTYAHRFMEASGDDLAALQEALDHSNLDSTVRYVGRDRKAVESTILSMWEE